MLAQVVFMVYKKKFPLKENFNTDNPIQLYDATKKSNELMATSYSHLYKMDTIGLRFFTVYGPWGRPDMALFKFTKSILEGNPIDVFNNGMLFESENIDKLIEAINNIELSDNKNVNKEIINQFSTEKISSEYYSLINKLI